MNMDKYIESINKFEENYKCIFTNVDDFENKFFIGSKENRICRFCGKDEIETTFKTVAHAIPECLGNKQLICLNECDECNKKFSENIEVHLDKLTLPFRTINFIKGKKKIPSYKTKDHKARVDAESKDNKLLKITAREDSNFIDIEEDSKSIKIDYDLSPHIPSAAYKTLVKMALSIVDDNNLNDFNIIKEWIMNEEHSINVFTPLKVFFTFVPGINPFRKTTVFLFKKTIKNNIYSEYTFIIAFGNVMYQIVIPTDKEFNENDSKKSIIRFLSPFEVNWPLGKTSFRILDWTQNTLVEKGKQPMEFSFENIEKKTFLNNM